MTPSFSPRQAIQDARHHWWVVALLMILGGLLGLLTARMRPPVYEGSVRFSINLDFVRSGPLTQLEEDYSVGTAGELIYSAQTRQAVADAAAAEGIQVSASELKEMANLERLGYAWRLRVQHPNPEVAAQIANLWAQVGLAELEAAYDHALTKEGLERYLIALESCLQETVAAPEGYTPCKFSDLRALQTEMSQVQAKIMTERALARNISPGLLFESVDVAPVSTQPVRYGQGNRALAGALVGLVIALLWILFRQQTSDGQAG